MHAAVRILNEGQEHQSDLTMRSDWTQVPPELLVHVCKNLELPDLLSVELCCSSWLQILRCSQVIALPCVRSTFRLRLHCSAVVILPSFRTGLYYLMRTGVQGLLGWLSGSAALCLMRGGCCRTLDCTGLCGSRWTPYQATSLVTRVGGWEATASSSCPRVGEPSARLSKSSNVKALTCCLDRCSSHAAASPPLNSLCSI